MKSIFAFLMTGILILGCSSKQTSAEAKAGLEKKYTPKVGIATKSELVEEFGNAEWCKVEATGGETCRFYLKKGMRWVGEKRDKKNVEQFDEVVAQFDGSGVLRSFKSNAIR